MRAIEKLKFKVDHEGREGLFLHRAQVYWVTPSGKNYAAGVYSFASAIACKRAIDLGLHTEVNSRWFREFSSMLRSRATAAGLRIGLFDQTVSPVYRPGLRHSLTRVECTELDLLMKTHLVDEDIDTVREIVEFLNDHDASSTITESLNGALKFYSIDHGYCGHFHLGCEAHEHRNGWICPECADESDSYRIPEDSGMYWNASDLYYHEGAGGWYTYPDEDEDGDGGDSDASGMLSYGTDVCNELHGPTFVSTPKGAFTIGVELEVYAARGRRSALVDTILSQANEEIICKHDGSLDDDRGVELVSTPMEYKEAIELFNGLAFPSGTKAWDVGTCGTHVHIDSRAFDALSIAKFLAFWNEAQNAKFIRKIAGRHPDFDSQASDYAKRVEAGTGNVLLKAKSHMHGSQRYRITNLCNLRRKEIERLKLTDHDHEARSFSTVEIRVFRASLKKTRMLAQIELAAASVYFARDTSLQAVMAKDFERWLATRTGMFPHLSAFLRLTKAHAVNPKTPQEPTDETVDAVEI